MIAYKFEQNMGYLTHQKKKEVLFMKKVLLGSFVLLMSLVFISPNSLASDNMIEDFVASNYIVVDDDQNEIVPISEVNDEVIEFSDELGESPQTRSATGYTYKNHTVLSTKTYTNKHLKTLKTSSVWSTAKNSIRPTISMTVSRTNSFNISLSNGTNNFSLSQSVSLSSSESYSAKPKEKGYRVSIGLYARNVVAKRVRISAYSNGTGKFSHYIYTNPTTFSGIYVGESHTKG